MLKNFVQNGYFFLCGGIGYGLIKDEFAWSRIAAHAGYSVLVLALCCLAAAVFKACLGDKENSAKP